MVQTSQSRRHVESAPRASRRGQGHGVSSMADGPGRSGACRKGGRGLVLERTAKRLIDVLASSVLLVLLAPLLLVLAAIVRLTMGSPALFRQWRPGLYGKPFVLYKLRSMTSACDREGRPLPDSERLTRIGRFLRKTSLDELPQLWNVLRGEMSLIGPRPLLMQYLARYTPEQSRRHEVLPGVTGWAQIHGRQALAFSRRLELDVWYVDHWSLRLDFEIAWKTVVNVLRADGVRLDQKPEEVDDLGLYTHAEATYSVITATRRRPAEGRRPAARNREARFDAADAGCRGNRPGSP